MDCRGDVLSNALTVCRPAAGACDLAELCTGTSPTCPTDVLVSLNSSCRQLAGPCDQNEVCDGVTAACPTDALLPANTVCRAQTDLCDQAEVCSGSSSACPANIVKPLNTVCRPSASACDAEEVCNGSTRFCPADIVKTAGALCRAAVPGGCDVAESCSGTTAVCPSDAFALGGTVCRASTSTCDPQEICTGNSSLCPTDVAQPTTNCEPYACTGAVGCRNTCIMTDADCGSAMRSVCNAGLCVTAKLVFVTNARYNVISTPSFGGVAGADVICQTAATTAGLTGTFKAWISSAPGATTEAVTRLTHATVPYVLTTKQKIALDWNDLVDGTLIAPIIRNELGVNIGSQSVWTGTSTTGAAAPSCSGWTTQAAVTNATVGSSGGTTGWTSSLPFLNLCNIVGGARLYCFEQ